MSTLDADLAKLINENHRKQVSIQELRTAILQLCDIIVDQEAQIKYLDFRYESLRAKLDDEKAET